MCGITGGWWLGRPAMGAAGRMYFDAHFDMQCQVEVLVEYLSGATES